MESSVVEGAVTVSVDGSSSTMLIIDVVSLLIVNIGLALSVLVTAGVANPGLLTVVVVVVVIVTAVGWSVVNALLVVISKVDDSMTFIIDVVSLLLVITRLEMSVLLTGCVINPGLLTDAVVRVCSVVN